MTSKSSPLKGKFTPLQEKFLSFLDCEKNLVSPVIKRKRVYRSNKEETQKKKTESSKKVPDLDLFYDLSNQVSQEIEKMKKIEEISSSFPKIQFEDSFNVLYQQLNNLKRIQKEIESRLKYFENTSPFLASHIQINEDYLKYVETLERSLEFFSNNDIFSKDQYIRKLKFDQMKSYGKLRDFLISSLKSSSNLLSSEVKEKEDNSATNLELININFKLKLLHLKKYFLFLKVRTPDIFFFDCFNCYYNIRYSLIYYKLRIIVAKESVKDIKKFIISCLILLIKIIEEEEKLFYYFFFQDENNPQNKKEEVKDQFTVYPLIKSYCLIFYEKLRYLLVHQNNIGLLCDILSILKMQFLNKNESLDIILTKIINDLEEAICFKSNQFIQNEISNFNDFNNSELLNELSKKLLNRLYSVISKKLFEEIVKETIFYTTKSLIRLSKIVGKKKSNLHSLLFLLKYLLELRENISFFKISFVKTEIKLDFTHIAEGISNFLKGKSTINIKQVIFNILINSQPKVLYKKIEMKKNLDIEIKTVCENFILIIAKNNFDKMIQSIYNQQINKKEIWEANLRDLEKNLEKVNDLIKEYLQNDLTRIQLIMPIKSNLKKIYAQYLSMLDQLGKLNLESIDEYLYTKEEIDKIIEENLK